MKRKGRPKQPAPLFHLPAQLWDNTLPKIKPKDKDGLPLAGSVGQVLFRFHVDEEVQRQNPEWAKDLYDTPPIPEEDQVGLSNLSDVMEASIYAHLRPQVKALRTACTVDHLSPEQVQEVLSRPAAVADLTSLDTDNLEMTEFMSRSFDSMFTVTNNPFAIPNTAFQAPMPEPAAAAPAKTGVGSSANARRLTRKAIEEAPTGSATPVKRFKGDPGADAAERQAAQRTVEGLETDAAFFDQL